MRRRGELRPVIRILWVSKNAPLQSQLNELRRLFGPDTQVVIDPNPFSSASEIVRRYREGSYDEMVLIAPLTVCRVICDFGYKPLWSEMKSIPFGSPDAEISVEGMREKVSGSKRSYKFIRFKRLESVTMNFSYL